MPSTGERRAAGECRAAGACFAVGFADVVFLLLFCSAIATAETDDQGRRNVSRRMDPLSVRRVESGHHLATIAALREGDRTSYRRGW